MTDTVSARTHTVWPLVAGGLSGAAGVSLAAVGAHVAASDLVRAASTMCLAHAPLLVALALADTRALVRWPGLPAGLACAGLLLFCGDMVRRAFFGAALFSHAAPIGGSLLIAAWLSLAGLAVAAWLRRR